MDQNDIANLLYRIEEKIDQSNARGQLLEASVKEMSVRQDRLESKIDESVRKSDERHKETTLRLDKVEKTLHGLSADDSAIRNEVRKNTQRITDLEYRMDRHENNLEKVRRTSDEGDHMQQAALQSAMNIQTKALQAMEKNFEEAEKARAEDSRLQRELLRKLVGWKDAWWFKAAVLGTAILVSGAVTLLKDCSTIKDAIHLENN